MTQTATDFATVRQEFDKLEARYNAALADDTADDQTIAKLRSDAEWRENSRQSYILAYNALVKSVGMALPKPGGGAYTPEEIIAFMQSSTETSAREVATLKAEIDKLTAENTSYKAREAKADETLTSQETRLQAVERKAGLRK